MRFTGRTEQDMLNEIGQFVGKVYPGTASMVIIGFAGRNERGQILVKCHSDSRGEFLAVWNEVKRGNTKGTVKGEARIKRNRFEIEQDIVKVYFTNGEYFICSIEDLPIVTEYTWYLNKNGYARETSGEYFHRIVMNVTGDYVIDHINRNKLDNRRCNLRICEKIDNSHNMNVFSTNTSGHTGVYKTKSGKYSVGIVVNYKCIHLGTYDDFDEACNAYDVAKEKYHKVEG